MKKLLVLFSVVAIIIYSISVNAKSEEPENGIKFFEGTWNEALLKSSQENKPLFLDVSTSWCGYCKKMKQNVFIDKEVGAYFNKNFINIEINAEQGEGRTIAQKYGVSSYPTLIIIDKNQKPIFTTEGYIDAKDFLKMGKEALKLIH